MNHLIEQTFSLIEKNKKIAIPSLYLLIIVLLATFVISHKCIKKYFSELKIMEEDEQVKANKKK